MTSFKRLIYLVFIFTLILVTGCGSTQDKKTTQTAAAQTALATLRTITSTSTTTPSPSATPTITLTPAPSTTPTITPTQMVITGNPTTITINDISFSLIVPEGWTKTSDSTSVALMGPVISGIQTSLKFSLDQFSITDTPMNADFVGIAFFSAYVQDTITEMVQNPVSESEGFFETPDGLPYFRWIMEHNTNGGKYHQAFYIFGTEKWFLTVIYGRTRSGGEEMDALIDATMNTLKFE